MYPPYITKKPRQVQMTKRDFCLQYVLNRALALSENTFNGKDSMRRALKAWAILEAEDND